MKSKKLIKLISCIVMLGFIFTDLAYSQTVLPAASQAAITAKPQVKQAVKTVVIKYRTKRAPSLKVYFNRRINAFKRRGKYYKRRLTRILGRIKTLKILMKRALKNVKNSIGTKVTKAEGAKRIAALKKYFTRRINQFKRCANYLKKKIVQTKKKIATLKILKKKALAKKGEKQIKKPKQVLGIKNIVIKFLPKKAPSLKAYFDGRINDFKRQIACFKRRVLQAQKMVKQLTLLKMYALTGTKGVSRSIINYCKRRRISLAAYFNQRINTFKWQVKYYTRRVIRANRTVGSLTWLKNIATGGGKNAGKNIRRLRHAVSRYFNGRINWFKWQSRSSKRIIVRYSRQVDKLKILKKRALNNAALKNQRTLKNSKIKTARGRSRLVNMLKRRVVSLRRYFDRRIAYYKRLVNIYKKRFINALQQIGVLKTLKAEALSNLSEKKTKPVVKTPKMIVKKQGVNNKTTVNTKVAKELASKQNAISRAASVRNVVSKVGMKTNVKQLSLAL